MLRWLFLSAVVVLVDQATKFWALSQLQPYQAVVVIEGWFNWFLAFNPGAAFSFLSDASGWQRWFFSALALVITLVLVVWLGRLRPSEQSTAAAFALIIGGAVGNLIDRIRLGHVVDFFDFYHASLAGWPGFSAMGHWPAFNIADAAITVGAVLFVVVSFRRT
jgi:signal peptidase II